MSTINFDMDGTIANLYADPDWLPRLRAHDASVYANAAPLVDMAQLARLLNALQEKGHRLAVISWLSKDKDPAFEVEVSKVKMEWLSVQLPSVRWDSINIVSYGTPKGNFGTAEDILFDDEQQNRENWPGTAYDVDNILEILRGLLK